MRQKLWCAVRSTAFIVSFGLMLAAASDVARADLPPLSARAIANGAEITREFGHEFVTVGAPGNAGYEGGQFGNNAGAGAVADPFRIARTQVTNGQWVNFANAYLPHIIARGDDPARQWGIFGSVFVGYDASQGRYVTSPGAENYAANMSWRMAARYCNWLCNDQRNDAAAFENGAYDTSTFGNGPNNTFTDQITHNAGARFYIPTRDQWVKAAYFDPNRNGAGQAGYWEYPHASSVAPRYDFPENGGESIAGLEGIPLFSWYLPVGSYQNTQSPWGLFDLSGSSRDWNEDTTSRREDRFVSGSGRRDLVAESTDSLYGGFPWSTRPDELSAISGLRIAALIPGPGSSVLLIGCVALVNIKRRRR
ncbi:MAG: formylglycine-generating enzyme family protein [Phycisphaerales bacterium]|nr:formylglycine-generating enzyme family protein [Phycisphaerales bacterium]